MSKSGDEISEAFRLGREQGLAEVIAFLKIMEQRYRQWADANPGLDGMQDSARGKIEAVMTAKRAILKMKG